jgi:hypothetical protein
MRRAVGVAFERDSRHGNEWSDCQTTLELREGRTTWLG